MPFDRQAGPAEATGSRPAGATEFPVAGRPGRSCQSQSGPGSADQWCGRHAGNHLVSAAGANLRELMERMGYTSSRAGLIYLRSSPDRQRALADAIAQRAHEPRTLQRALMANGVPRRPCLARRVHRLGLALAALRYHCSASAFLRCLASRSPRLTIALDCPVRAALRNQRSASAFLPCLYSRSPRLYIA